MAMWMREYAAYADYVHICEYAEVHIKSETWKNTVDLVFTLRLSCRRFGSKQGIFRCASATIGAWPTLVWIPHIPMC